MEESDWEDLEERMREGRDRDGKITENTIEGEVEGAMNGRREGREREREGTREGGREWREWGKQRIPRNYVTNIAGSNSVVLLSVSPGR